MTQSVGELYPQLYQKALEIVSGAVKGCNVIRWREIAHDLTVDFLFFSKSFSETYDASLGMLKPFFASYIRKRCQGVRMQLQKERVRTQPIENYLNSKFLSENDHSKIVEIISEVYRSHVWLQTQYYRSKKGQSYCLADVYLACLESTLRYGGVNLNFMRSYLKVDIHKLRGMLSKMRRILRERECQKRTKY